MDLPGPKYRTGRLKDGQAILKNGAMLTLTTEDVEGDATLVPVNLPTLPQDAKVGDKVLLDDGAMQLKVLEKKGDRVICRVITGGILTERRGLVVPACLLRDLLSLRRYASIFCSPSRKPLNTLPSPSSAPPRIFPA